MALGRLGTMEAGGGGIPAPQAAWRPRAELPPRTAAERRRRRALARRAPAGGLEAAGCGPGGAAPLCVRSSALRTAAGRAFARPRGASVVAVRGVLADGF